MITCNCYIVVGQALHHAKQSSHTCAIQEAQKSSQEPVDSSDQCRGGSSVALQEPQTFSSRWRLPFLDAAAASIVGSSRCADDGDEEGEDGVSHLAALYPDRDAHLYQNAHLFSV